ncbi:MAG TPA: hypothetical protein VN911_21465 [Candidatus Acidoferrum sp.]|nr:hypothetical protein [Candidatus Acidoferrum sp.]
MTKTAGNNRKSLKKGKEVRSIVAATGSVRELNGLLRGRRRKPISIEEMNAAIVRGALKGNV